MRKKIFLLCGFLLSALLHCFAQNNEEGIRVHSFGRDGIKEQFWVDSVRAIIKKGFVQNEYQKENWKKQLAFVNSCVILGLYYEKKYDAHELPDMKKALYYYNKVADMDRFPDDDKYFKALAIRTNLFRKLADIYYKGKGVKKDCSYSRELALRGIGNNGNLFSFYSKRYYGCDCIILDTITTYIQNHVTACSYEVNPFAERTMLFKIALTVDKFLAPIIKEYKLRRQKDNVIITITSFPENSYIAQSRCAHLVEYIKTYLIEREKIPQEDISENCEVSDGAQKHIVDIKLEAPY